MESLDERRETQIISFMSKVINNERSENISRVFTMSQKKYIILAAIIVR